MYSLFKLKRSSPQPKYKGIENRLLSLLFLQILVKGLQQPLVNNAVWILTHSIPHTPYCEGPYRICIEAIQNN